MSALRSATLIPVNALIDCIRRNNIYYTNALLLLVRPNRAVIFVARQQLGSPNPREPDARFWQRQSDLH